MYFLVVCTPEVCFSHSNPVEQAPTTPTLSVSAALDMHTSTNVSEEDGTTLIMIYHGEPAVEK